MFFVIIIRVIISCIEFFNIAMFDLPIDLPKPTQAPPAIVEECIRFNSQHFGIPELALEAILDVEGGKMCTVSKNSNGSYDLGLMQINTINFSKIQKNYPDVTAKDIACKPCLNITLGAWLLSHRIKETKDIWTGVGNYHSKTPKYRTIYLKRISSAISRIIKKKSK
jgi:hypothetical protein